jgi:hypothetical protein
MKFLKVLAMSDDRWDAWGATDEARSRVVGLIYGTVGEGVSTGAASGQLQVSSCRA